MLPPFSRRNHRKSPEKKKTIQQQKHTSNRRVRLPISRRRAQLGFPQPDHHEKKPPHLFLRPCPTV
jgi:hypothetical protein